MKVHYALRYTKRVSVLVLALLVLSLGKSPNFMNEAQGLSESDTYVHNFINTEPYGNWTLVEKPMFPVRFNQSQIPIGSNWTVVSPLTANHSYHVYFYGEWINLDSNPSTDYDVYVYNPMGELESYHTESAGLPEHLGATVEQPFFAPRYSGDYRFVLRNDPRESKDSQSATFMIIENVECNKWQEVTVRGKENNLSVFGTSWAFEFITDSQQIEVLTRVPETIDMYEMRLYLMANTEAGIGEQLNDVPLAWEPGLYGETKQIYGGYNLESEENRGLAYASSEFYGQDMRLEYTSPVRGKSLYHVVFTGEEGEGRIDFLVKTEFGLTQLNLTEPVPRKYPDEETTLTFVSDTTDLTMASLNYSINNWSNFTVLDMQLIDSRTCMATIPCQPAGTTVAYQATAQDLLENTLTYSGSYAVKSPTQLNLTLQANGISLGENITLTGLMTPPFKNLTINLVFTSTNGTFKQATCTQDDGSFTSSFKPATEGNWIVQAAFTGNSILYESSSQQAAFEVTPPSFISQYSIYIFAAFIAGVGTITAVVYFKKRGQE